MVGKPAAIVWFRQDLRIRDNPALYYAAKQGHSIVPVYIWSPKEEGNWPVGGAGKVWLHYSLESIQEELRKKKTQLVIRKGSALSVIKELVQESEADSVYWNKRYEPSSRERDNALQAKLNKLGIEVKSFNGSLIYEPWEIETKSGNCFKVFTPFWEAFKLMPEADKPLPLPSKIPSPSHWPQSMDLQDLKLLPKKDWAGGIRETWEFGEQGGRNQLTRFIKEPVKSYSKNRNYPACSGTSKLSPYLHFGEISPRQIWHELREFEISEGKKILSEEIWAFLRELGWREFSYHLLYHFPQTAEKPLRREFASFPWKVDNKLLRAWQKGLTGYPIVDAGMRELWTTGWMHNRVRMVAASFLVKDLLLPWQKGAEWFWDTLVDADLANNTMGWQWSAGCGADAAPFFRIFNPVLQGEKFDPNGDYVRKWIPELTNLPNKWIHKPWEASQDVLNKAEIQLGEDYPLPVVDHREARQQALDAFQKIKKKS